MRKFLLVGVTMLLSLTTFASLSAGLATVVAAQEPTADQVNHVAKKLYCPVCPNTPLDVCETQACEDWRALIHDKLAAGEAEQTIIDYFVAQYGVEVLAAPPRQGFGALVWTLPLAAVLVGGWTLLRFLRGWQARQAEAPAAVPPVTLQLPAEYLARLEEDVRKEG